MNHSHLLTVMLAASLLAACGEQAAPAASPPATAAAAPAKAKKKMTAAEFDALRAQKPDPCVLLTPQEVEAALGAPLAAPPYRGDRHGVPDANGESCNYASADLHRIIVEPTWSDGKAVFKMIGGAMSQANDLAAGEVRMPITGTVLNGEWDVASVAGCCQFLALLEDQLLSVDVSNSKATLEQAATLADAALLRFGAKLAIRGADGNEAAQRLEQSRPKPGNHCALLTRADAEAVLGPLGKAPEPDSNRCNYTYAAGGGQPLEVAIQWRGGYGAFRDHNATVNSHAADRDQAFAGIDQKDVAEMQQLMGSLGLDGGRGIGSIQRKPVTGGPWDEASAIDGEFNLVRKDVYAQISAPGMSVEKLRVLAVKMGQGL